MFAAADTGSLSTLPYFSDASSSDPLVLPISSERVLARFPAFFMDPDLPESQQVYRVVAKFFDRHRGALRVAVRGDP